MRYARTYILLAAVGQSACGASSKPAVPAPAACPKSDASVPAKERTFNHGKPDLPEGLRCLPWPMTGHRKVSSEFLDPDHPFTPGRHNATDLPAPVGTDVLSPVGGEVSWIREVGVCEDAAVAVRFDEGWAFSVHHLSRVDVRKGEKVVPGQRLGLSGGAVGAPGSGPWTTGPHLHFALAYEGDFVDAEKYFCP